MKSGLLVNRVFVVLAIPLLAYLSFSTAKKAMEVYQLNQQAASIRQDIAQLKDRNAELRRQMEYVQSPGYVEKVAREQLNLVKPDDIPLVLVSPLVKVASSAPSPSPQPARPQDIPPNWKRWWNLFFGDGA
ncbi:MAG: septum formation initiator family protein [Dehalococcoidia bacterium]|nr:septum formation initiator family protein [Dehalococcoidia bacterium]